MERYIGPDAHASSSTIGTVGASDRRLHSQVVETNAGALRLGRGAREMNDEGAASPSSTRCV